MYETAQHWNLNKDLGNIIILGTSVTFLSYLLFVVIL